MMKLCKRILILTVALLCIFGALGLETFGEEPGTAAETETTAEGETSAEPQEELTGIKKFFNGFLSLYENGGIVTEVLGSTETQVVDGRVLTVKTPPTVLYYLTYLLMAVFAYVLGSINFGVLISTKMCNEDVRRHGSGNAGMTNVLRVYGKKPALLTFLGDYGKGLLSAFIGMLLGGCGCGYFALAFCMIGHAFPVFFKFKGGKCVATLFGGMTALEPAVALILFVFFFIIVWGTKYVSLGSVIGAALLPLMVEGAWKVLPWHVKGADFSTVIICSVFFACFIVWLHRANLKRLYNGEERKTNLFGRKKSE